MTGRPSIDRSAPDPAGKRRYGAFAARLVSFLRNTLPGRGIGLRFAAAVVLTAALVFAVLITVISVRLQNGVDRQAAELERLSDEKLAERLDSETKLVAARVRFQLNDAVSRLEMISHRHDMARAFATRNGRIISAVLAASAKTAGLEEVMMVDSSGTVFGSSDERVDLTVATDRVVHSPLLFRVRQVIAGSMPGRPLPEKMMVTAEDPIARVFAVNQARAIGMVALYPIHGEAGEAAGVLVGYRMLKRSERVLNDFVRSAGTGVLILGPDGTTSVAGVEDRPYTMTAVPNSLLLRTQDGQFIGRCLPYEQMAEICALSPINELYLSRNELVRIAQSDARSLIASLVGLGVLSLCAFAGIATLVVGQVTRPLVRITNTVSAVAGGRFHDEVVGIERTDEIGNIARAVEILQTSMRERDQLRADVERQNELLTARDHELNLQNMRFDAALNNMPHALCMFDEAGQVIVSNYQLERIYGLSAGSIKAGMTEAEVDRLIAPHLAELDGGGWTDELSIATAGGGRTRLQMLADSRTIAITRQHMLGGGSVVIYEDITERRRAECQIMELATRDALTQLPNRFVLRQRMETSLAQTAATGHELTLYCLDLDAFKAINDTLGHPFGDLLLCRVAERLIETSDPGDTVVRLGGDEFAVVTMVPQSREQRARHAERIIAAVAATYDLDGNPATVGVSVGIATAPLDGTGSDELLRRADLALYAAKAAGKNTYTFFAPALEDEMNRRMDLEADLRKALETGQFEPFFQPIVEAGGSRIIGFEALLRWRHPTRGMVPPSEFIPFAEEVGLIGAIGEWVVRRSCELAVGWPLPLKVAVNMSPKQVKSRGVVQMVVNALATSGLEPSRLELEITESVLLEEDDDTVATLLQLKALGVRFAMDDFGTGYSSLSCLRAFPFDRIKIDQGFVKNILVKPQSMAIVKSVIALAQSLGMETTAEGVETAEVYEVLRSAGCSEIQGYHFGRPRPNADVAEVLRGFGMTWDEAPVERPRLAQAG